MVRSTSRRNDSRDEDNGSRVVMVAQRSHSEKKREKKKKTSIAGRMWYVLHLNLHLGSRSVACAFDYRTIRLSFHPDACYVDDMNVVTIVHCTGTCRPGSCHPPAHDGHHVASSAGTASSRNPHHHKKRETETSSNLSSSVGPATTARPIPSGASAVAPSLEKTGDASQLA